MALTVSDKLVLAANDLESKGKSSFTAEDLIVAAWQRYRDSFGLSGYPSEDGLPAYPDSNRVLVEIMGSKPLRQKGLLTKVGAKVYQLTESGKLRAKELSKSAEDVSFVRLTFDRRATDRLKGLLNSRALQKWREGRSEDITFYDACGFWGISPRSSANEFHAKVAGILTLLEAACQATSDKSASYHHGSSGFDSDEISEALTMHDWLQTKFSRELAVIENRSDRMA
jgi:hypothetical protein